MRKLSLIIFSSIAFTFIWAVWPRCAFACSCMPPAPPAEALKQSNAVFFGRVVNIRENAFAGGLQNVEVTFAVSRVWKGPEKQQLTVVTANNSAACGIEFQRGAEYLVYAHGEDARDARLDVNLCSRTRLNDHAKEDLAALGEGKQIVATEQPTSSPLSTLELSAWLALAAIGSLSLLGAIGLLGIWVWRRAR